MEEIRLRPMYAGANMGNPSREEGFVSSSIRDAADGLDPGSMFPSSIQLVTAMIF